MTVDSTQSVFTYAGNGVTVDFNFSNTLYETNSLVVIQVVDSIDSSGVSTLLVLDTDYTVAIASDNKSAVITLVTATPSLTTLVIARDQELTQPDSYQNGGRFPAKSHEKALDREITAAQSVRQGYLRAPRLDNSFPVSPTLNTSENPDADFLKLNRATGEWMLSVLGTVTTGTIVDGAVTTPKLSNDAVTVAKIAPITATGTTAARRIEDRLADYINVLDFGASPTNSAVDNQTAFTAALNHCRTFPESDRPGLMIPSGEYQLRQVDIQSVDIRGDTQGGTRLVHADGFAEALLYNPFFSSGSANPWYGIRDLRLNAGTLTTALFYTLGSIDSNVPFDNIIFNGSGNTTTTCDGASMRDYLNMSFTSCRWDGFSGFGIHVRTGDQFGLGYMRITDCTYDHGTLISHTGSGFLSINTDGRPKGPVCIDGSRLEVNGAMAAGRGIINIEDTTASSTPVCELAVSNTSLDIRRNTADQVLSFVKSVGGDIRFTSFNSGYIGCNLLYDGNKQVTLGSKGSSEALTGLVIDGRPFGVADDSATTMLSNHRIYNFNGPIATNADSAYVSKGDLLFPDAATGAFTDLGRTVFVTVADDKPGTFRVGATSITPTGSITTGTNQLTLSVNDNRVTTDMYIVIAGAGPAAADLETLITDYNAITRVATIDTNAGTTVAGAVISLYHPRDLLQVVATRRDSAKPAVTGANYVNSDICWNSSPAQYGPAGWVRAASVWREFGILGSTQAAWVDPVSATFEADLIASLIASGLMAPS